MHETAQLQQNIRGRGVGRLGALVATVIGVEVGRLGALVVTVIFVEVVVGHPSLVHVSCWMQSCTCSYHQIRAGLG